MTLDTVSFTVTAPGAGPTAMAAVAGDSALIRNSRGNASIFMLAAWTNAQAVGFTQVLWPSGHDLVRGLRYRNTINTPDVKLSSNFPARFRAQDPLTVSESGSATAGDVELFTGLMFYDDLPGVDANLINLATLVKRGVNELAVDDIVTPVAASVYSGARALNVGSDLLKADTDYALLGASFSVACHAATLRGVDSGNLRVSIPGSLNPVQTTGFFSELSLRTGLACIPVFNSANRGGIFQEILDDENFAAVGVSWNFVELKP
jgi:hypothetical protein